MLRALGRALLISTLLRLFFSLARPLRLLAALGLIAVPVGGLAGCGNLGSLLAHDGLAAKDRGARVVRVVDGDTVIVSSGGGPQRRVRLLGLDAPETTMGHHECAGASASAMLTRLLPAGARVRLVHNRTGEDHDRYGRELAWVYRPGDQVVSIQERLIARGLAMVYRYRGRDLDAGDRLDDAQLAAKRHRRGVWGRCGGDFHTERPGRQQ